ncbi:MAG: hypothetical protein PWQ85_820 [Geotoga sp.]|nr:hypothetical protein [Geotoga sp.]
MYNRDKLISFCMGVYPLSNSSKGQKMSKMQLYNIILWIVGLAATFLFTLWVDLPIVLFAIAIVAVISRQWFLGMAMSIIRGTGVFGLAEGGIEMLWITLFLLFLFMFGIYRFFFDTDKFLKKRKLRKS